MATLPTSTITFLFTDIEGSTKLWEEHGDAMQAALARHDALVRQAIESNHGFVFKTVGDAFHAAFQTAPDALAAALAAQGSLRVLFGRGGVAPPEESDTTSPLQLRVRMALLTGVAEERDGDYFGPPLNSIARMLSAGHGGQVLLSQATYELARRDRLPEGVTLRDLGEHHLKDLIRPEHIYQIVAPDLPSEFPPLKTLDTLPNNLPLQLTSFIGREKEIAEIKRLLATTRLLTLTGAGGCGKTRLSLQVAADSLDGFKDGVWFIELAPLADPELAPQAIASALGLRNESARPMLDALKDYLKEKTLLLVLDNCEHLIDACARVSDALLYHCPRIKILATSREALGIAGETAYRVPSLACPDPKQSPISDPQSLTQFEAVRLFIDRALSAQPTFTVTNANAPAVAEICQRLDGIPLAIELAEARIKALKPEEIAARLDDSFRLLTGGSRTALPRQQTLRAAIDWSYNLLSEPERVLLRRLSVFAGGATLVAAEEICADPPMSPLSKGGLRGDEILDLLTRLADKSMLIVDESGEATRYKLLETLRQYAHEKLLGSGETEHVRQRHLDFFLKLAEEAEPKLEGGEQIVWLNRLEREHDNLRAALQWSLESGKTESGLRLAGALNSYWHMHSHWSEGRQWLQEALARGKDASAVARAKALYSAGFLAVFQSDYRQAVVLLEESLKLFRELGDKRRMAWSLFMVGMAAGDQGDWTREVELVKDSLAIRREISDKRGVAYSLNLLGEASLAQGDYSTASHHLEEGLALFREAGDKWGIGLVLANLGNVALFQRDYERATALSQGSLALWREFGDKRMTGRSLMNLGLVARGQCDNIASRSLFAEALTLLHEVGDKWSIVQTLEGLAPLDHIVGNFERAAHLFGAAEILRETIRFPLYPAERADYEQSVVAIRAQLDETTFAKVWAEGRAMTMEQAVEYALQEESVSDTSIQTPPPAHPAGLTEREVEVLRLIAQGLTDAQVAEKLVISTRTVNSHLRSIYSKIGVTTRTAAARFAVDNKLV